MTTIETITLEKTVEESTKRYGELTIEDRALPDFRDGLKPVQRRVVYQAWRGKVFTLRKTARLVGDVLGMLHPHGDCLRGDSIVALRDGTRPCIKDLVGDKVYDVWALDTSTGNIVPTQAHSFRIGQNTNKMYRITLSGREVVECTANHPFFNSNTGSWVKAEDLKKGMPLAVGSLSLEDYPIMRLYSGLSFNKETCSDVIESLVPEEFSVVKSVECITLDASETFYDFTVDKYENMLLSLGTKTYQNKVKRETLLVAHNSSVVSTIMNMVHDCYPMIHGEGNWGSIDGSDSCAGMRYTECCLSTYGKAMLTKARLDTADFVPNYDDKDIEPVVLPVELPNLLLNGSYGVATGISPTNIPAFELAGVLTLIRQAYKGKTITPVNCARYLKIKLPYGGQCTSSPETLLDYYKTGDGTLSFECTYTIDYRNHQLHIIGLIPHLTKEKITANASALSFVKSVFDQSKRGTCTVDMVVQFIKKPKKDIDAFALEVISKCCTMKGIMRTMCTQVTERSKESVTFRHTNVPNIINDWVAWRISVEKTMCKHEIHKLKAELSKRDLLLRAIKHKEAIIQALSLKSIKAIISKVMGVLDCTEAQAKFVLSLKIRQLAGLEAKAVIGERTKLRALVKSFRARLNNTGEALANDLGSYRKVSWGRKVV